MGSLSTEVTVHRSAYDGLWYRCERAEQERDRLQAAIDRHVAKSVWETASGYWAKPDDVVGQHRTRAEAEAAYRQKEFPGLAQEDAT